MKHFKVRIYFHQITMESTFVRQQTFKNSIMHLLTVAIMNCKNANLYEKFFKASILNDEHGRSLFKIQINCNPFHSTR